MRFTLSQKGYNLVLLRIKADVALIEGTLFSDMNAADNEHRHGGTLDDLKMVDLISPRKYNSRIKQIIRRDSLSVHSYYSVSHQNSPLFD